MTFIAAIPTKESVVMVSDSRETVSRYVLSYDHLIELLQHPDLASLAPGGNVDEDRLQALLQGRIIKHNEPADGAPKMFRLTDCSAILVAGTVEYGGTTVADIVAGIQSELQDITPSLSGDALVEFVLQNFRRFLGDYTQNHTEGTLSNPDAAQDACYIVASYDPQRNESHVSLLKYVNGQVTNLDEIPYSFGIDANPCTVYMAGLGSANSVVNALKYVHPKLTLTTSRGLDLLSVAAMCSLLWERLNKEIHEVGGSIRFAVIDNGGYRDYDGPVLNWHA